MIVGVIGSGAIGPDLAYGFASNLDKVGGGKVFLLDIRKEALDAGMKRLEGYLAKALDKGKMAPKAAQAVKARNPPRAARIHSMPRHCRWPSFEVRAAR